MAGFGKIKLSDALKGKVNADKKTRKAGAGTRSPGTPGEPVRESKDGAQPTIHRRRSGGG